MFQICHGSRKKVVEKGESTVPTIETQRKNYGTGIVPGAWL